jgi:hypothetical protein
MEQAQRGFTVIGELAAMLYVLQQSEYKQALEHGPTATESYLRRLQLLGGEWGFWVQY